LICRASLAALALAGAALTGAALSASAQDAPLVAITFGGESLTARAGDVVRAEATNQSGTPAVSIRLAPALDRPMADLTGQNIGAKGEVLICGVVRSRPVVMNRIETAQFVVFVDTAAEARQIATALMTGTCGPSL
jgi:preprotein translocase subunit SecD